MQHTKIRCRGVIMHEGRLLVVKHAGGREFYSLPGGHLEFGEDPQECIRRELIEELGIIPVVGRLLYVYSFISDEEKHSIEFFFEIQNSSDYMHHEDQEKTHAHELEETIWISPSDTHRVLPEIFTQEWRSGKMPEKETRFIKG